MKRRSTEWWIRVADLATGRLLHVGTVWMMPRKTGSEFNSQNHRGFPLNYPLQRYTLSNEGTLAAEMRTRESLWWLTLWHHETDGRHLPCGLRFG